MRSSSSSVNPSARCSGCSGATCVKDPSLARNPDRAPVRFAVREPSSAADAAGPRRDLGVVLHVHQGRGARGHAGRGRLLPRSDRDARAAAGGAVPWRLAVDLGRAAAVRGALAAARDPQRGAAVLAARVGGEAGRPPPRGGGGGPEASPFRALLRLGSTPAARPPPPGLG